MKVSVQKMVLAAMFLAMALVLPFLTGQIPQIGSMLCPMHIPVLICGFVCGGPWGLAVGFVAPLLRSFIFGMPYMFPTAVGMAFELAVYGLVCGLLYRRMAGKKGRAYIPLVCAMVLGRVAWGMVMVVLMGMAAKSFTMAAFVSGALVNALPGIAVQLVLIPLLVTALERASLMPHAAA